MRRKTIRAVLAALLVALAVSSFFLPEAMASACGHSGYCKVDACPICAILLARSVLRGLLWLALALLFSLAALPAGRILSARGGRYAAASTPISLKVRLNP